LQVLPPARPPSRAPPLLVPRAHPANRQVPLQAVPGQPQGRRPVAPRPRRPAVGRLLVRGCAQFWGDRPRGEWCRVPPRPSPCSFLCFRDGVVVGYCLLHSVIQ
jgi:hypothetical protein